MATQRGVGVGIALVCSLAGVVGADPGRSSMPPPRPTPRRSERVRTRRRERWPPAGRRDAVGVVAPKQLEVLRIAGHKNLVLNDATKVAIRKLGITKTNTSYKLCIDTAGNVADVIAFIYSQS